MAQCVKALATKPHLSSITRTHMVEGENPLLQGILWPPNACFGMYTHSHAAQESLCFTALPMFVYVPRTFFLTQGD